MRNFHIFITFLLSFIIDFLFHIMVNTTDTCCDFNLLKLGKTCFVIYRMIYPGKRSSVPEKNLYSVVVGWNILYLSVRFILSVCKLEEVVLSSCLYSSWVGLLTFFLDLEGCRMCSAAAQCRWLGFLVW